MKESPAQTLKRALREAHDVHWEATLLMQMRAEKFHVPQLQFKFHPTRKWAFDFAWPEVMLAVEVDGGSMGVRCGKCQGSGSSALLSGGRLAVFGRCRSCRGVGKVPGRHTSGEGFEADLEKINEAQALGWRVYRFTPEVIKRGEAMVFIQKNFIRRIA